MDVEEPYKKSLTDVKVKASTMTEQISYDKFRRPFNNRKKLLGRTSAIVMIAVQPDRN